jgi:sigma-B regulation protein RsbU (phosphoserine phosphatase)
LAAAFLGITLLLGMELIDKIKYRDELELARQLQSELIPKELPQVEGIRLAAFNHIANTVGGDIYDFIPLRDGRLAVLFGDASGHGMAAGLIMAVAHATFKTQLEVDPSPKCVFTTLNRIICQTGGSRSFFAGIYLLMDPSGDFQVCVAGHPPILQIDSKGEVLREIGSGAYPLGIKREYEWSVESGTLGPGESFVIYSDGLPESRSLEDEEFGEERIQSICRWTADRPASERVAAIVGQWKMFATHTVVEDDVSLAIIDRVSA